MMKYYRVDKMTGIEPLKENRKGKEFMENFIMYRELIGKLIEGHNWARLQEPCPEKEIKKAKARAYYCRRRLYDAGKRKA